MELAKTGRRLSPYRAQRLAEDGSPYRAGWKCCQFQCCQFPIGD